MNPLYVFSGIVTRGINRGKSLGFPTANIPINQTIPEGVYTSDVTFEGTTYPAATFIGAARTFGEQKVKAECHLLDFNANLYGKTLTIRLYQKIRNNQKFHTVEALVDQMKKDILLTRRSFRRTDR